MTKPETEKLLAELERMGHVGYHVKIGDHWGTFIPNKASGNFWHDMKLAADAIRAQGGGATPDAAPDADWYRRNIAMEPDDVMAGVGSLGGPTQCWVLVKDGDMHMVFDSTQSAEEMQESFGGEIYHMVRAPEVTDAMVNRFLTWKLPLTVSADQCATIPNYVERTGTNLLTAVEARAMLEHVIAHARSAGGEGRE
jgi:hypothetical protein